MPKHPLTDEISNQILDSIPELPCDEQGHRLSYDGQRILNGMFEECDETTLAEMRSAADWQLEQVIEWMKVNLMKHDFHEGYAYLYDDCSNAYIREEELLKDLREAMRPAQENN